MSKPSCLVVDMHHLEPNEGDPDASLPPAAWRLAQYLGALVGAASLAPAGVSVATALSCRRRPKRRPCTGHLLVYRQEVPARIDWQCPGCAESGIISGWAGGRWDLSRFRPVDQARSASSWGRLAVSAAGYRALRDIFCDFGFDNIILAARWKSGRIVMQGPLDALDKLLGYVAAESNHESNRVKRKVLDELYETLQDVVNAARPL